MKSIIGKKHWDIADGYLPPRGDTRQLDSRQAELALISTIAYAADIR